MIKPSNPYKEIDTTAEQEDHMVQIRIFDILYDDNVCNLIYMEDMTKVYRYVRHERA